VRQLRPTAWCDQRDVSAINTCSPALEYVQSANTGCNNGPVVNAADVVSGSAWTSATAHSKLRFRTSTQVRVFALNVVPLSQATAIRTLAPQLLRPNTIRSPMRRFTLTARIGSSLVGASLVAGLVTPADAGQKQHRTAPTPIAVTPEHPRSSDYRRAPQVRGFVQRRGGYSFGLDDATTSFRGERVRANPINPYRSPIIGD
jgi:hypothetical protein